MKILILGETFEAAEFARAARRDRAAKTHPHALLSAVDSVRARTLGEVRPEDFPAAARRGGVKGAEGLLTALQWDRIGAVVDASHPFDGATRAAAAQACAALGLPLLQLHRALWPVEGRERRASTAEAARRTPVFSRAFLWIGLDRLEPFKDRLQLWTLTRAYAPPPGRYPLPRGDYAVGAPPFTEAHERILLEDYRINQLVLENSGGALGAPMLRAAAALDRPVTLIDPPAAPAPGPGGARVATVEDALAWLRALR